VEAWRSPPGRGSLFGHDRRAEVRQRGPTVMSDNLEAWEVLHSPWSLIGTIVRTSGKGGRITCEPKNLEHLLRRPAILKMDPMDFLTGWSNGAVACWPRGNAPGVPTPT
jgi:hypothetical protein